MNDEIGDCAHCGGTDIRKMQGAGSMGVGCPCGLQVWKPTLAEAIAAWNTRPAEASHD